MILILSRGVSETSTNKVIDYLISLGVAFFRFNGDDFFNQKTKINFYFNQNESKWEFDISSNEIAFTSRDVNVVWYRRDFFDELEKLSENQIVNNFLKGEARKTYDLFYLSLKDKVWINKPNEISNKLFILEQASKIGLPIPNSFVTNNLEFIEIINSKEKLITKPVSEGVGIVENNTKITTFTALLDIEKIKAEVLENENFIFPSLFQSQIEKEYEIRVFYFFEKCYSMAIFSQNDEKTKVDFRDYNNEMPNKMSRYKLPEQVEDKVKNIMNLLNMNSGSIDFIRSKGGNYIFLEINPVGQFDFLEIQGNYNLSEILAHKLVALDEKK